MSGGGWQDMAVWDHSPQADVELNDVALADVEQAEVLQVLQKLGSKVDTQVADAGAANEVSAEPPHPVVPKLVFQYLQGQQRRQAVTAPASGNFRRL